MISTIKSFIEFVKELILFIPIIYKAKTWDYSSVYLILYHWLGRMEYNQFYQSHHVHAHKYAKDIRECRLLLKRLYDDLYFQGLSNEHDKRWGPAKYTFHPIDDNHSCLKIDRPNVKNDEDREQERKEFIQTIEKESKLAQQDIDRFLLLFKKHHREWWS